MISAIMMNGTGYDGARTHNGAAELQILECSDLKYAQRPSSSHSIALNMQYSTACDWLANSCESILDISQSYASGFTVTLRRFLRDPLGILGIQWQSMPNNLNKNEVVWQTSANYALGLNNHDRIQPISGSYAGHPDHNEVRGPVRGGEDAADRISGAIRPGNAAEPLHPQAGAGVRVVDADRRVPRGIVPVRGGSGAIGDGREAMA